MWGNSSGRYAGFVRGIQAEGLPAVEWTGRRQHNEGERGVAVKGEAGDVKRSERGYRSVQLGNDDNGAAQATRGGVDCRVGVGAQLGCALRTGLCEALMNDDRARSCLQGAVVTNMRSSEWGVQGVHRVDW